MEPTRLRHGGKTMIKQHYLPRRAMGWGASSPCASSRMKENNIISLDRKTVTLYYDTILCFRYINYLNIIHTTLFKIIVIILTIDEVINSKSINVFEFCLLYI